MHNSIVQGTLFEQDHTKIVKENSCGNKEEKFSNCIVNDNGKEDIDIKIKSNFLYLDESAYTNSIEMQKLKLVPTEIFWIRLAILVPLLPIFAIIFYPYYSYIHQFQTNWAAALLAFKSGTRWNSMTILPESSPSEKYKVVFWRWQNWDALLSVSMTLLLVTFALQVSFPSSYIILIYAFVKTLFDEFTMQCILPSGYLELEIITCIITVMLLFFIVCVNLFFYL